MVTRMLHLSALRASADEGDSNQDVDNDSNSQLQTKEQDDDFDKESEEIQPCNFKDCLRMAAEGFCDGQSQHMSAHSKSNDDT
jgi:hypothetical protein